MAYGAYSFEDEAGLIYQTNIQSIVNLTGLLAKRTCAAFVHAGSSSEYGANCSASAGGLGVRAEQSLRGIEGGGCELPAVHGQIPKFSLR